MSLPNQTAAYRAAQIQNVTDNFTTRFAALEAADPESEVLDYKTKVALATGTIKEQLALESVSLEELQVISDTFTDISFSVESAKVRSHVFIVAKW